MSIQSAKVLGQSALGLTIEKGVEDQLINMLTDVCGKKYAPPSSKGAKKNYNPCYVTLMQSEPYLLVYCLACNARLVQGSNGNLWWRLLLL